MALCESGCSTNTDSIHIDINTTSICNIACTYCSEGNECGLSTLYLENTQVKVEDLINKLAADPAKEKTINFWGGEPLVNWDFCKAIIDGFKDDDAFSFFFYTNGIMVPKYIDQLVAYNDEFGHKINKDGKPRLVVQISYDGRHLTDTIRIDKQGKGTSKRVEEAYHLLVKNKISTSLKAVISSDGFPYLYDSFIDMYNLQGFYGPTPDLWSSRTEEEYEGDLVIIAEQLEKIATFIIANKLPPETFSWFDYNRNICSTGARMLSVDLDGQLYPCHAAMYGESEEHSLGHIDNFTEVKEMAMEKFSAINEHLPLECQTCTVNFCMKCQIANYGRSEKETYEEKFTDYQANWQVCKLFKVNDKFNKTVRYVTIKGI